MTPFERRQRLLALLHERGTVKVTELADVLDVSEGTIRNDLNSLAEDNQLRRVRGGATILKTNHYNISAPTAARMWERATAKQRMARRAANMVKDGEAIMLDASTTVFHMAPYLQDRQNLTIITNGIEVARVLANNPANTIILMGGVVRSTTGSIVGDLGERFLQDFHIKMAFVSGGGFSLEAGLTETDFQEAQIKSHMIRAAQEVVALVDATKFGQTGLLPFARADQIDQLLSDGDLAPQHIEAVRQAGLNLTICGETTATSYTPPEQGKTNYTIGFANLSEEVPFAVDVRRGLEEAVAEAGNIDLIVADNELDGEVALHVAERLVAKEVDLAIEYQIDEKVGTRIMNTFQQAGIPVIAVDIPMVGASYFGADNYQSGRSAGVALGHWIEAHWEGEIDRLIVLEEPRAGALPAARMQGQLDGLQAIIGDLPQETVTHLDGGSSTEASQSVICESLPTWSDEHRLAVISFNDDVALGALNAFRKAGREQDVVVVGQGADRPARMEIRRPNSRFMGSTAYMPETYGEKLIPMALKILWGQAVPPATYVDHAFIDAENIDLFYPDA